MAAQNIAGPYQVTEDDVERSSTLDLVDVGEWYILINGSLQFCESERSAHNLKAMLLKLV